MPSLGADPQSSAQIEAGVDEQRPTRVLLISGMPASGKSTFVEWLGEKGWGTAIGDEMLPGSLVQVAWEAAIRHGDDGALLSAVAADSREFAIEFGFPAAFLPNVQNLMRRGFEGWFFDADLAASRTAWMAARPSADIGLWERQVDGLVAIHADIAAAYGGRLIKTLTDEDGHVPLTKIAQLTGT
jgi:hypothetical protein